MNNSTSVLRNNWQIVTPEPVLEQRTVVQGNGIVYYEGAFIVSNNNFDGEIDGYSTTTGVRVYHRIFTEGTVFNLTYYNSKLYVTYGFPVSTIAAFDANNDQTSAVLTIPGNRFTIADGILYSVYRRIIAYNADTGAQIWQQDPECIGNTNPVVSNGLLYAWGCNNTTNGEGLSAFHISDGTTAWVQNINEAEVPTVSEGVLYVQTWTGTASIDAINPSTGALLWTHSFPTGYYITDIVAGDNAVYISFKYNLMYMGPVSANLIALTSTNTVLWENDYPTLVNNYLFPLGFANGIVYYGIGGIPTYGGTVYTLDGNTGKDVAGSITYPPGGEELEPQEFMVNANIVYVVLDGHFGGFYLGSYSIAQIPPPTVTNTTFTGTEGQTGTGTVQAKSASNKKLTLKASGLPSFASFKDNGNGTGTVNYAPKAGNAGTYTFNVIASYGTQTGKGTITLTIVKATVAHTKMFVYLEGLTSVLSPTDASKRTLPTDSFGQNNSKNIGIGTFLNNKFKGSLHTMFSYAGSTSSGQPKSYECKNTFDNTIRHNVDTLKAQLGELMQKTPNLDIYLVGHSYGGVLIMALLADMKYNGIINVNGGSIKGVVTLDSPLGGVPGGPKGFYYTKIRESYENVKVTPQCSDLHNESNLESVTELTKIFATGKIPYGSNGHFASLMQEGTVTNQTVSEWAASHKIAVATIGNTVDWSYLPRQCILDFPAPDSTFQSTQWIIDKSTRMSLFGRFFTAGKPSCSGTNAIGENHNLAMANLSVEVAIQQLITMGKITSLPIPSLTLQ